MFTVAERERVSEHVLAMAERDERVVAAAVVGSLALGGGDQWSDVDLTFAVADDVDLDDVLADWTQEISRELDGAHLFDLAAGGAIYRVFMMRECLQLDVSFTPASQFRPGSPRFRLIFGSAGEEKTPAPPAVMELVGWSVLWARHARVCLERGDLWQAVFCVNELRDNAMSLACIRHDLPARFGKGFDDLPQEVRAPFAECLPRSLEPEEIRRALATAVYAFADDPALRDRPDLVDRIHDAIAD
ncbi:MAG: nucleotidyltransferase domain-containing protein [Actinomycetota bacterium]|nr:nucleotidyltransferase domain-containing protein [Actinomycetota bacterium]